MLDIQKFVRQDLIGQLSKDELNRIDSINGISDNTLYNRHSELLNDLLYMWNLVDRDRYSEYLYTIYNNKQVTDEDVEEAYFLAHLFCWMDENITFEVSPLLVKSFSEANFDKIMANYFKLPTRESFILFIPSSLGVGTAVSLISITANNVIQISIIINCKIAYHTYINCEKENISVEDVINLGIKNVRFKFDEVINSDKMDKINRFIISSILYIVNYDDSRTVYPDDYNLANHKYRNAKSKDKKKRNKAKMRKLMPVKVKYFGVKYDKIKCENDSLRYITEVLGHWRIYRSERYSNDRREQPQWIDNYYRRVSAEPPPMNYKVI